MKFSIIVAMLLFAAPGVGLSASQPTPVSGHFVPKTPVDKIELRLRQQFARIHLEARLGKLTKDQVNSLKTQVEAIRKAEIGDIKQNGSTTLTDDQIKNLNQQLDDLSKSIPVR